MTRVYTIVLAAALCLLMASGRGASAGGQTRYYAVATGPLVVVDSQPAAMFSWVADRPGRVKALWIAPTADIRGSFEDRIVGSVWVNASYGPTIDDLFAITSTIPAMHLHKLADVGAPNTYDMPVNHGDVVTVLLGDEQSGAPPLPPATWVLEVEE